MRESDRNAGTFADREAGEVGGESGGGCGCDSRIRFPRNDGE